MYKVLNAFIFTTALIACSGTTAIADDVSDRVKDQEIYESELHFFEQSQKRQATPIRRGDPITTGSVRTISKERAATIQGFAPIDTLALSRGSNN